MKKIIKILFKKLPQQKHADFLDDLETMADEALSVAIDAMSQEILDTMFKERLAKADQLPRGWTGKIPKIEVNFSKLLDKTVSKYMNALRYILLGDIAGKEAKDAAIALGLTNKSIPGVIPSAYLDSIDTHREYYGTLLDKEPREMPKTLISDSLKIMSDRSDRFMEESELRLKNKLASAIEGEVNALNSENTSKVMEDAHSLLEDETARNAVKEASKDIIDKLNSKTIGKVIREASEDYRKDWNRMVSFDASLASGVGTHQVVSEIYGADDDDVRLALVALRDEKTCEHCKTTSRNSDGSFKLYKLKDLEPAGSNYGRKKDNLRVCVDSQHIGCRCMFVYVPKGFTVDNRGNIIPSGSKK